MAIERKGVTTFNGVSGPVTLVSADSSVTITPDAAAGEIDLSAVGGNSRVDFDFSNEPSLDLKEITSGKTLERVVILITTPFTSGTNLQVGFTGSLGEVADTGDIDPQTAGLYVRQPYKVMTATDTLKLTFSGTTPTAGAGTIFIAEGA